MGGWHSPDFWTWMIYCFVKMYSPQICHKGVMICPTSNHCRGHVAVAQTWWLSIEKAILAQSNLTWTSATYKELTRTYSNTAGDMLETRGFILKPCGPSLWVKIPRSNKNSHIYGAQEHSLMSQIIKANYKNRFFSMTNDSKKTLANKRRYSRSRQLWHAWINMRWKYKVVPWLLKFLE